MQDQRWLLLRYDTESRNAAEMTGFLEKMVAVHRAVDLPVTLFCTGGAIDAREAEFHAFNEAVSGDSRFEIGDHSYSHIGVGYEAGNPVPILRADYEQSLASHERVLGRLPTSVSICGTGGKDGAKLPGFDATPKATEELAMLVDLGIRSINAFRIGVQESKEFTDYASLGFPDVSGFPSGFSDTSWLYRNDPASDFLAPLRAEIDRRADEGVPMPVICHDWVAWNHAPDKALTHIVALADYARSRGYTPMTHAAAIQAWRKAAGGASA